MPIYEFECVSCGEKFEFFKCRSDETAECPQCGEKEPQKLVQQISTGVDYIPVGPNWCKPGGGREGY